MSRCGERAKLTPALQPGESIAVLLVLAARVGTSLKLLAGILPPLGKRQPEKAENTEENKPRGREKERLLVRPQSTPQDQPAQIYKVTIRLRYFAGGGGLVGCLAQSESGFCHQELKEFQEDGYSSKGEPRVEVTQEAEPRKEPRTNSTGMRGQPGKHRPSPEHLSRRGASQQSRALLSDG